MLALAESVFNDRDKAARWLGKPRKVFDGACPFELLAIVAGGGDTAPHPVRVLFVRLGKSGMTKRHMKVSKLTPDGVQTSTPNNLQSDS